MTRDPLGDLRKFGRTTLQDVVYETMRSLLMTGEMLPGQAVTVREISERAGTSAMPVREAMRRLVAEGALEVLVNGTTRVRVMDGDQRRQMLKVRIFLEGVTTHRATERVGKADLKRLSDLNEEYWKGVSSGDLRRASIANQAFHFHIYRLSGADVWIKMIEDLWAQNGPYVTSYTGSLVGVPDSRDVDHHAEIIKALRRGDGDAAAASIQADISGTLEFLEMEIAAAKVRASEGLG